MRLELHTPDHDVIFGTMTELLENIREPYPYDWDGAADKISQLNELSRLAKYVAEDFRALQRSFR